MSHALIIDDNMLISHAIRSYLEPLGFTSFDSTWTEEQAVAAAHEHTPDLIVVGDELAVGSSLAAAQRISKWLSVPVVMLTGDPVRAQKRLKHACSFEGPFMLNQIEEAVALARNESTDPQPEMTLRPNMSAQFHGEPKGA
jgi:CheY-like chemotaxis protein